MDQDPGIDERMLQLMRLGKRTKDEEKEDAAAINKLKRVASSRLEATSPEKALDELSSLKHNTLTDSAENSMEEEVRHAELESRLRRMITEVLKPSIAKVTRLQTDHELMCSKFQDMIDGHQEVLNAQKEAKEHSEMITVFKNKLTDFWAFSNQLEDKIVEYQKSALLKMEELEQACDLNKNSCLRLGRNLDRSMQDIDRANASMKSMELTVERGLQRNKEHTDTEIRQMHLHVAEVRDLIHKLEIEIWGPEEVMEYSPPSLRRLDMQMKNQKELVAECLHDIASLQKLESELNAVAKRSSGIEGNVKELQDKSKFLAERVETCAEEAKADFKQASNLMAAFSANLVREARTSFKDELKHAQKMQQDVSDFVRQTRISIQDQESCVQSLSGQVQAMMKEVRTDLDICDNKRKRDKQGVEEQMRQLQSRVASAFDASESMLRGLEHVSGVVNMSLQSERMSVALDLQDFVERKDTPYVGLRESPGDRMRKLKTPTKQSGMELERLQRIMYQPQPVNYQGANFERPQLLALREKLVHIAQESLQQGPVNRKLGPQYTPDLASSQFPPVTPPLDTRSSTPSIGVPRPGSRGQPGARGSPLLGGHFDPRHRETPEPLFESKQTEAWSSPSMIKDVESSNVNMTTVATKPVTPPAVVDDGLQLPVLSATATAREKARASLNRKSTGGPHTAR